MVKEFISQLPPDKLSPFEKHPYQVREDAALVGPAKRGVLRAGQRASAALGGAEIGLAHRAGAGAGDERRRSGDPDGGQQSSEGKPAAQRKGIRLQDEVGGNETPRKINFGATRTEVDN